MSEESPGEEQLGTYTVDQFLEDLKGLELIEEGVAKGTHSAGSYQRHFLTLYRPQEYAAWRMHICLTAAKFLSQNNQALLCQPEGYEAPLVPLETMQAILNHYISQGRTVGPLRHPNTEELHAITQRFLNEG